MIFQIREFMNFQIHNHVDTGRAYDLIVTLIKFKLELALLSPSLVQFLFKFKLSFPTEEGFFPTVTYQGRLPRHIRIQGK